MKEKRERFARIQLTPGPQYSTGKYIADLFAYRMSDCNQSNYHRLKHFAIKRAGHTVHAYSDVDNLMGTWAGKMAIHRLFHQ